MHFLLLSPDLMLISAAQGAASRRHAELSVAATPAAALEMLTARPSALIVIDLRTPALDIHTLVESVRSRAATPAAIMACGPHVHEASLAAAAAAGCDEVVTRGEFDRRLDAALVRLQSTR
jgi:CheY-like chemotaxis protein